MRLLLNHPDIEWIGATSDYATALAQIEALRADTVLIEQKEGKKLPTDVLKILETNSAHMRVIRLSLADNQLTLNQSVQGSSPWSVTQAPETGALLISLAMGAIIS